MTIRSFRSIFTLLSALLPAQSAFCMTGTTPAVRPVLFEPGLEAGEYRAHTSGGWLRLTPAGIEFATAGRPIIRLALVGGGHAEPLGDELLPSTSSYFLGSDPRGWRTGVANYAKVRYRGVYPGTDLVFRGSETALEYDFVIAPNADPSRIRMRFDGAGKLSVTAQGDLLVDGWFTGRRPRIYQESAQGPREIGGRFRIHRDRTVSFETGPYDHTRALTIDPVIAYTSYLGGFGADVGNAIATDKAGNIYVAGVTDSANFPAGAGPVYGQAPKVNQNAFITKFAPVAGGKTQLLFTVFLGDNHSNPNVTGATVLYGLAIDSGGNIVAAGSSSSTNYPTVNAAQPNIAPAWSCQSGGIPVPCAAGVLTKIAPSGQSLVFSTYYGGSSPNWFTGVALDAADAVYAVGIAGGPAAVPGTQGAIQASFTASESMEMVRFDRAGTLLYATYLGGSGVQWANAITVEKPGVAWIGGYTTSSDIPTTSNAFLAKYMGSGADAYLARIDTTQSGSAGLTYGSFYNGASGHSQVNKLFLDPSGQVVFCGGTSSNLPVTSTAMQSAQPGWLASEIALFNGDGFIARINPAIAGASGLTYSSFIGGSDEDWAQSCALDPQGNFVVAGGTRSGSPFMTPGSPIPYKAIGSSNNVFVIRIDPTKAGGLIESILFGGEADDEFFAMATDSNGFAYLTGQTFSQHFPVSGGALQPANGGDNPAYPASACCGDAWISQLNLNVLQPAVAELALDGGDFQSGAAGSVLPLPLNVHLADANGNQLALAGYQVTFTATGGVTFASPATGLTDGTGVTGVLAKLGATSGTVTATIASPAISYTFHVYVGSGPVPQSVGLLSGNNQSGAAGSALPSPLVVQLLDAKGAALSLSNVNVLFKPTNASVSAAIVPTDANGRASVSVTLGSQTGAASVQAVVGGAGTVTANFTVGNVPAIDHTANAASGVNGPVVPGEYLSIYGSRLGPTTGVLSQAASGEEKGLGGVKVMFGAVEAYLAYASATQLNVLVPYGIGGSSTTVQVSYNGAQGSLTVPVGATSPGIFTTQYGPGPAWVVNSQDSTWNSAANPAAQGSYIVFWATGQGQVTPASTDGAVIASGQWPVPMSPVTVMIGTEEVTPAWVGLIYTGEIQVNLQIPGDAPVNGAVPLQLKIGGVLSRPDVTVSIKAKN